MDFSKIDQMFSHENDLDIDDSLLEDELNAIISGKDYNNKKVDNRSQQLSNKSDKSYQKSGKSVDKSNEYKSVNTRANKRQLEFDPINIDHLSKFDDIDPDYDDDEDIDEDNEDLLSEINDIVDNTKPVNKVANVGNTSMNSVIDERVVKPIAPKIDYPISLPKVSNYNEVRPERENLPKSIPMASHSEPIQKIQKSESSSQVSELNKLRDQYKKAALNAKRSGNQSMALSLIKTSKQIDLMISASENGQQIDLSQLPPIPPLDVSSDINNTPNSKPNVSNSEIRPKQEDMQEINFETLEINSEDAKKLFDAPPPPMTVMEALEQRLSKFKSTLDQANKEENPSKARRLGRIVKQYETVIKDVKKGKTVDFEELPTPPGFGPIPVETPKSSDVKKQPVVNQPTKVVQPEQPKKIAQIPSPVQSQPEKAPQVSPNPNPKPKTAQRPNLKRASSTANKQLNYLLERQRLFKEAALLSKQKGDIQQAKEYLRQAKGFDPLIEATQNGLPIDATSIPTPPQMTDDFVIVTVPEGSGNQDMEKEEIFRKIQIELQNQIEMCNKNKEYFLQLGDVSTASKFEKYSTDSKKDMDMLIARWTNGDRVPTFKYETRSFSIVICNTEVATNEISVEVLKALDIHAKSDVDTYVRLEFPFPTDNTQTCRTKTIKNSINPVFNETFKFNIDRKSRSLPRVLKRHPLKLELFSKGGFLSKDSVIGTALVKLTELESKCTLHDTFELTEGRKAVGGRIEARVRIREPLLSKQVEEVKEKWLVFT